MFGSVGRLRFPAASTYHTLPSSKTAQYMTDISNSSTNQYCRLSSDDEESDDEAYDVKQAHERLITLSVSDDDSGMSDSGESVVCLD